MEIFVDFGLFEVLAVVGVSSLARRIYSHRATGAGFAVASVVLPALLMFFAGSETMRWLSAAALVTAIVNVSVIVAVLRNGPVPTLTVPKRRKSDAPPPN